LNSLKITDAADFLRRNDAKAEYSVAHLAILSLIQEVVRDPVEQISRKTAQKAQKECG